MNLYIIIGEDDFLVTETAKKVIGDVGSGLEVIDSRTSTNEDSQLRDISNVDASFSTPPFLDPIKVTWWKNVGFLPSGGKSACAESVKTALERFAQKLASSQLPENQKLVITAPKLLQSSIFAKTLKGAAEFKFFTLEKYAKNQLRVASERVSEFAPQYGLKFAPGAIDAFVARVGSDTRSLLSELSKMRDFLGEKNHTVTREAINEISSSGIGVEPEMWSVTDALGDRDFSKVVDALHQFEQEDNFAVFATTVIEKFFRQLLELKDAEQKGKFGVATAGMAPFVAQKNLRFIKKWKLNELRAARMRFLSLREKSVSSAVDINSLIFITLARICR